MKSSSERFVDRSLALSCSITYGIKQVHCAERKISLYFDVLDTLYQAAGSVYSIIACQRLKEVKSTEVST
jgi:hypothetical protein